MSDQVYKLLNQISAPVEPTGSLALGWVPGTWVKIVPGTPTYSHVICKVDKSDGIGQKVGFLLYGPQHKQPVEDLSDMFLDKKRSNGDTAKNWTAKNASLDYEFDEEGLLQKSGTRVATAAIAVGGMYKIYCYETLNKLERNAPGTGAALVYQPGDFLYVSENGLFTKEQETVNHGYSGYGVYQVNSDEEGDFLIVSELTP